MMFKVFCILWKSTLKQGRQGPQKLSSLKSLKTVSIVILIQQENKLYLFKAKRPLGAGVCDIYLCN